MMASGQAEVRTRHVVSLGNHTSGGSSRRTTPLVLLSFGRGVQQAPVRASTTSSITTSVLLRPPRDGGEHQSEWLAHYEACLTNVHPTSHDEMAFEQAAWAGCSPNDTALGINTLRRAYLNRDRRAMTAIQPCALVNRPIRHAEARGNVASPSVKCLTMQNFGKPILTWQDRT